MILKMKKVHVILQEKDTPQVLKKLRELGTVHIEHQAELTGHEIAERREEMRCLNHVIDILDAKPPSETLEEAGDWSALTAAVLKLVADIEQLKEAMFKRQNLITQWQPWGDFNPDDFQSLEARGIYAGLYEFKMNELAGIPGGVIVEKISVSRSTTRCLLVARDKKVLPPGSLDLPPAGLHHLQVAQTTDQERVHRLEEKLGAHTQYLASLRKIHAERQGVLELEEAKRGMHGQGPLAVLKGFCPENRIETLAADSIRERFGLLVEDVTGDDAVPTCLSNPRWVEMIRPVFQLIDILPGYREIDVSLVFLVFFSIFFGMLIGDAGYGTIFLLANLTAHWKLGKKIRDTAFFKLMYVLCGSTILWGLLTGVLFGQQWLVGTPVQPLVPWLSEMNHMIFLCFTIAAIHLSIAHVWRLILKFPSPSCLAEAGWLALVWCMFFVANMFVLNRPFPGFGFPLLYSGMALVVFFTAPHKNPLKAIGPGLGALAMNFINSFTDVVSYIRLFAVGLATVAVADAFNEMAAGIGFHGALPAFFSALILLLGHTLNMILAGLAVLVHGIRLNVLEFSGHLGMEWGGQKYKPFRKISHE